VSDKSAIEWTDALPVALLVTGSTEGLHVKPMEALIAEVVVVLLGGAGAIEAGKRGSRGEVSATDRRPDSIGRRIVDLGRWSSQLAALPDSDTTAVIAGRGIPIPSALVDVKEDGVSPCLAPSATLLASLDGEQVGVQVYAATAGCCLEHTFETSHRIIPVSDGNNYTVWMQPCPQQ
jgi:hypothetical protein